MDHLLRNQPAMDMTLVAADVRRRNQSDSIVKEQGLHPPSSANLGNAKNGVPCCLPPLHNLLPESSNNYTSNYFSFPNRL